jgi:hypothetical protein
MYGFSTSTEKEIKMADQEKPKGALSTEFEKQAAAVAYQFSLDYNDVKNAYKDTPASLSSAFNSMDEARRGRNRNIGWAAAWTLLFWPVAPFPAYKVYKYNNDLNEVGMRVKAEVDVKRLPPPAPPAVPLM